MTGVEHPTFEQDLVSYEDLNRALTVAHNALRFYASERNWTKYPPECAHGKLIGGLASERYLMHVDGNVPGYTQAKDALGKVEEIVGLGIAALTRANGGHN